MYFHQNDDITEEEYFDEDDSDDNESDKDVIESNVNESISSQKKVKADHILLQIEPLLLHLRNDMSNLLHLQTII